MSRALGSLVTTNAQALAHARLRIQVPACLRRLSYEGTDEAASQVLHGGIRRAELIIGYEQALGGVRRVGVAHPFGK